MTMLKKLLATTLAGTMLLFCAACGAQTAQEDAATHAQQEEVDLSQYAGMDLVKKLVELDRLPEARAVLETLDSPEAKDWQVYVLNYIPVYFPDPGKEEVYFYVDRNDWHGALLQDTDDQIAVALVCTLDEHQRATKVVETNKYSIDQIQLTEDGMFSFEGGLKANDICEYTYNEQGNVLHMISDRESGDVERTFSYDDVGRLVKDITVTKRGDTTISAAAQITYETTYTYDEQGRVIAAHQEATDGKKTSVADRTITYDADGRRLNFTEVKDGKVNNQEDYTYDAAGNVLIYMVGEDKRVVEENTYTYDANGNILTKISCSDSLTTTYTYTYDANGNLLTDTKVYTDMSGKETKTTYTYNEQGRCLTMTRTINGEIETEIIHTYDELGREVKEVAKTKEADHSGKKESVITYTYDGLYRTTEEDGVVTLREKLGYYPNNTFPWWIVGDCNETTMLYERMGHDLTGRLWLGD